MEKRTVLVGLAVVAAAAALLAWNRFGNVNGGGGDAKSLSAAAESVMGKAASAVDSIAGGTTPPLPLPSDMPASQRVDPMQAVAAAASAVGGTSAQAAALAQLQARMKQATANGRTPTSEEVIGYLTDLERVMGSSKVFGIDLAVMRSNVELMTAMRNEAVEIDRLNKKASRSDEDNRELARHKERVAELQQRMLANNGMRTSAASAAQGAQ